MNLENYGKRWTDVECDYIRKNYPKWGKKKCAAALGRTECSVKRKAKLLRTFNRVVELWNEEDTKKLIELYPVTDTEKVAEILGTTKKRVWQRASYLGITKTPEYLEKRTHKKKSNAWTNEEIDILKRMYADNYTEDIPINRTITAIRDKAHLLGLKKGERILKQIRFTFKKLQEEKWGWK